MRMCLLLFLLAGCGVDLPGGQVRDPFWLDAGSADGGGDGYTGSAAGDAIGPATPETRWYAFWNQTRRLSRNPSPLGPDWQASRTTSIGLVKVTWQGDTGKAWTHTCAVQSNVVFDSQLTYPAAFVNAMDTGPATLHRSGAAISQETLTAWLGLKPGYSGAMPALGAGQDKSVVDGDGDGNPGVTVYVNAPILGQQAIYVVQRSTTSWQTSAGDGGSLSMTPTASMEQVTVGATSSFLVAEDISKPLEGEAPVELHWMPVQAGLSCASLVADAAKLTGQAWPP